MDNRIKECLRGEQDSYIFPFFWLHGEPQERLYEEILAIKNSGINEFCAECRPYDNFCKDEWWDDFGFILKTAKELGMRVWLLDDRKFPTGYANGYLEAPEREYLRKRAISEFQSEAVGPMKKAKFYVGGWLKDKGDKILKVVAYRHIDRNEGLDWQSAVDLTGTLNDGMVTWDVPEGTWRVCVMIESFARYKDTSRFYYYIDALNPESCHAMIDAIYQPHYEHFSEYFGNTFAGFFSDEPGFYNTNYSYNVKLGKMFTPYPWNNELPRLIAESSGLDISTVEMCIPALWEELGDITATVREHYMETVTKLYSKNFCYMLGDWCREHGVMYIGHVIEDMNCHQRMGCGAGHFFRALDGQDMAGIDIVLMQDIPGFSESVHRASLYNQGLADPAFFRYTLPKLASSHSHIQPLKKGRAMCEIFGAFGWAEGLPYMKGLTDIMLVGGVNHYVPHAFSCKEEDPDCPPHFYNKGRNVQYPLFKNLMEYMGRCSHALRDGIHRADVAVFYNPEGEWSGGDNKPFQEICRELSRNLLDFDIIPSDYLENARVENGRVYVNNESYGALIVSESEIMSYSSITLFEHLAKDGLPIIFVDSLPKRSAENKDISDKLVAFEVVKTGEISELLRSKGIYHVSGEGKGIDDLRFYHVSREGSEIYLFSNEAIRDDVDAVINVRESGEYLVYEPWDNKCYRGVADGGNIELHIEKGNMLFIIFGDAPDENLPVFSHETERKAMPMRFDISVKEEGSDDFSLIAKDSELFDISEDSRDPHFSGEILYKGSFEAENGFTVIDLGEVGETAEAWLNGEYLGARINAPYKFDMSPALRNGVNDLRVVVKSNLAHRRRDNFSSYIQIAPTGIIGDISICKYSK